MSKKNQEQAENDNGFAGFKQGFDSPDQFYQSQKRKLSDNILIDFFLSIGLPRDMVIDILKHIVTKLDGDFSSEKSFEWVKDYLLKHPTTMKVGNQMILNLYPDCLSDKMPDSDPRKNYIDKEKHKSLAQYGFPLGFKPKYCRKRPPNELVPNCFIAGEEKTYMQYLIFYESLEENYLKAYRLFQHVNDEIENRPEKYHLDGIDGLMMANKDDEDGDTNMSQSDMTQNISIYNSDTNISTTRQSMEQPYGNIPSDRGTIMNRMSVKNNEVIVDIDENHEINKDFFEGMNEIYEREPTRVTEKFGSSLDMKDNQIDDIEINRQTMNDIAEVLEYEQKDTDYTIDDNLDMRMSQIIDSQRMNKQAFKSTHKDSGDFHKFLTGQDDNDLIRPIEEGISEELFNKLFITQEQEFEKLQNGDDSKMHIWIPKAICLVSVNPYFDFFSQILIDMWFTLFVDTQTHGIVKQQFMVEQIVKYLVDSMPPTTPGLTIEYKLNSQFLIDRKVFGKWNSEDLKYNWDSHDSIQLHIPTKNTLPFQNKIFYDRLFQLLSAEDIVNLFTALLTEEKTILIVSRKKFDLIAVVQSLFGLMYPFDWQLVTIPFLYSDPDYPNESLFQLINNILNIVIGIHDTAYEAIKMVAEEEGENVNRIIIVDLRGAYCEDEENEDGGGTGFSCCVQNDNQQQVRQSDISDRSSQVRKTDKKDKGGTRVTMDPQDIQQQLRKLNDQSRTQTNLNHEELSEYAMIKEHSQLQIDNYQQYFGIPKINHRIFDQVDLCQKCCCSSTSAIPSRYTSQDGQNFTRLLRWQINEQYKIEEIPFYQQPIQMTGEVCPPEIHLPKAYKQWLINKIKACIRQAWATREQNPNNHPKFYHNFLSDKQIFEIRNEFFCINAKIFKNYKEFMKYDMPDKSDPKFKQQQANGGAKWEFEIDKFINERSANDKNKQDFYHLFFYNENYEAQSENYQLQLERDGTQGNEINAPKKYLVKQQHLQNFFETMEGDITNMDPEIYCKLINFHFAQILDASQKVSMEQYQYAQLWTTQNWSLKNTCIILTLEKRRDRVAVKSFNKKQIKQLNDDQESFQRIKVSDHLLTLNEGIYDHFLENLDDNEEFGMDYVDLFYYQKHQNQASYIYHLFPKLDKRLIESKDIILNGLPSNYDGQTIREEYINQIIDEFKDLDFFETEQMLDKKVSASIQSTSKKSGVKQFTPPNIQEQIEMKFVYSTWIYLWSSTFSFIDENEQKFRFNQLKEVLRKLKEPIINGQKINLNDILKQIMQTTLEYSRFELSDSLYRDFKTIFNFEGDITIRDKIQQQKIWEEEEEEKNKRLKKEVTKDKEESKTKDENLNSSFSSSNRQTKIERDQKMVDQCINMIFDENQDNILETNQSMSDLSESLDNTPGNDMIFADKQDAPKKKKVTIGGNMDPTKNNKRGQKLYKGLHDDPGSVYDDKEHKIQKSKEQILDMSSKLYQKVIMRMKMRARTLINYLDPRDVNTEDDIVLICLREDCLDQRPFGCRGQLLEPKLKKSLMNVPLNREDASLATRPKCAHCGLAIHVPRLKITLGDTKRTFREDKQSHHRDIKVNFLSALQIYEKTIKNCKTKRDRVRVIDPKVFRHDHQELFWNVIHYFINHSLPYDIFLPYKQTEEIEKIDQDFEQKNNHNGIEYDGPSALHIRTYQSDDDEDEKSKNKLKPKQQSSSPTTKVESKRRVKNAPSFGNSQGEDSLKGILQNK